MTKMVNNTPNRSAPTAHADSIAGLQRARERYARQAEALENQARAEEAKEAREMEAFIAREMVEAVDPERLRNELATCERMAANAEDTEAAGRWRGRAGRIERLMDEFRQEDARQRARNADFGFVRPIMSGPAGTSVLDTDPAA
jgi:hypothetical protein